MRGATPAIECVWNESGLETIAIHQSLSFSLLPPHPTLSLSLSLSLSLRPPIVSLKYVWEAWKLTHSVSVTLCWPNTLSQFVYMS